MSAGCDWGKEESGLAGSGTKGETRGREQGRTGEQEGLQGEMNHSE